MPRQTCSITKAGKMQVLEVLTREEVPEILVCVLLAVKLFILEGYMRRGREQKAPIRGKYDHISRMLSGMACAIALLIPVLDFLGIGLAPFGTVIFGWCGLIIMLVGVAVRQWAMSTLRDSFTRALIVTPSQRLVTKGPYRLIRHPGYLGNILTWSGFGLTFATWIGAIAVFLSISAGYVYRIRSEESLLLEYFGQQYKDYMTKTKKLIPFTY